MTTTILTQAGLVTFSYKEGHVFATVSGMSISAAVNELPKSKIIEIGDSMPPTVNGWPYIGNGRIFKVFKHKGRQPKVWRSLEEAVEMAKIVAKPNEIVKFYHGNFRIATMQNGIVTVIENPIPELI